VLQPISFSVPYTAALIVITDSFTKDMRPWLMQFSTPRGLAMLLDSRSFIERRFRVIGSGTEGNRY
jgi:hypothetical protein